MFAKSQFGAFALFSSSLVLTHLAPAQGWSQTIIHVNADASPGGDGTSWANAYRHPIDALTEANALPEPRDVQIWIARGTYMIDGGLIPDGTGVHEPGTTSVKFNMQSGIGMYGGFLGTEQSLQDRMLPIPEANLTVLTGDTDNNDVVTTLVQNTAPDPSIWGGTYSDNDGPVVSALGQGCTLDGLVIRGGKSPNTGGGVRACAHGLTIERCMIYANYAAGPSQGQSGFPNHGGGGLAIENNVHDCVVLGSAFVGNWADSQSNGGAVSIFSQRSLNEDERAGAVFVNCLFMGNWGNRSGAVGLYASWQQPNPTAPGYIDARFLNCTFTRNRGAILEQGAALSAQLVTGGDPWQIFVDLSNCIIYGNQSGVTPAVNGHRQISLFHHMAGVPGPFDVAVRSSVSNANKHPEVWYDPATTIHNVNPWPDESALKGPDNILGTIDDDHRLVAGSPCIDAADNNALCCDEFDLDDDGDVTERSQSTSTASRAGWTWQPRPIRASDCLPLSTWARTSLTRAKQPVLRWCRIGSVERRSIHCAPHAERSALASTGSMRSLRVSTTWLCSTWTPPTT